MTTCIACTILNIFLQFGSFNTSSHLSLGSPPNSKRDLGPLRRPSHFIGFETIVHPSPPVHKQSFNYPRVIVQIDSKNPDLRFPDDYRRYMSHIGTFNPEERQVRVTNSISTVLQFMAVDYGMETCELHLQLDFNSSASDELVLRSENTVLSIFRLNSTTLLDAQTMSFSTRPAVISNILNIPVNQGTGIHWHRKFSCPMHEFLTFEIAVFPLGLQ
ncbi:hypothetical protein F5146DRAFT_1136608 [Armillaria mellea]|nr:hypothetical protein F5146DRAFT_1136608 [Armillaria mellea]